MSFPLCPHPKQWCITVSYRSFCHQSHGSFICTSRYGRSPTNLYLPEGSSSHRDFSYSVLHGVTFFYSRTLKTGRRYPLRHHHLWQLSRISTLTPLGIKEAFQTSVQLSELKVVPVQKSTHVGKWIPWHEAPADCSKALAEKLRNCFLFLLAV